MPCRIDDDPADLGAITIINTDQREHSGGGIRGHTVSDDARLRAVAERL
jgi:hypothetical protein